MIIIFIEIATKNKNQTYSLPSSFFFRSSSSFFFRALALLLLGVADF